MLEDAVLNGLCPGVDAVNWGIGQVCVQTQANREEIAGVRVDIAALETSVRADITALKAAVTMQVNNHDPRRAARRDGTLGECLREFRERR